MTYIVNKTTYQDVRPITVNGVRLDTLAYNVSSKIGLANAAGLRGANPTPSGRDGSIWTSGKKRNEGSLSISMWASPLTEVGVAPTEVDFTTEATKGLAYDQWRTNMDKILSLFDSSRALLDVRIKTGPDVGDERQAFCEVVDAIDPTGMHAFSEFTISLKVPAVYWQDPNSVQYESPVGVGAVALHSAVEFSGSTAPMNDLVLSVLGPITNPRITDEASGHYVQLNQALTTGQTWTLDSSTWASTVAGLSVVADTISVGVYNPKLFTLTPPISGDPSIRLGGTAPGAATQLVVAGRRKYR